MDRAWTRIPGICVSWEELVDDVDLVDGVDQMDQVDEYLFL